MDKEEEGEEEAGDVARCLLLLLPLRPAVPTLTTPPPSAANEPHLSNRLFPSLSSIPPPLPNREGCKFVCSFPSPSFLATALPLLLHPLCHLSANKQRRKRRIEEEEAFLASSFPPMYCVCVRERGGPKWEGRMGATFFHDRIVSDTLGSHSGGKRKEGARAKSG